MKKVSTMEEAADLIYEELKEVNAEIKKEDVYDTILDEVLESVEDELSDADIKFLEDNIKTPEAIDEYLQKKISSYHELINDIVSDMTGE